jgi:cysteine desulfurase/selenocysteine lyase
MTHPDIAAIRKEFPALRDRIYLNTATFGQVPLFAADAMAQHMQQRNQTASADFMQWFADMDDIRGLAAQLIGATADDIAFVPNASTGLAWLMNGLKWQAGDEVLTLDDEFPNQLYQGPAAARAGVGFRAVPWQQLEQSITERTRVVLMSTVNYGNGRRARVEELGPRLRERGILLYLDATQSLGAVRIDMQRAQPAMLCADAYKWMMSPNGAGICYISPELRQQLQPVQLGWRSDTGWRGVDDLNHGDPRLGTSAADFEGGMLPFPSIYAMGAVLRWMQQLGHAAIEAHVLGLASELRRALAALGAEVNEDNSNIVSARFPTHDSLALVKQLREREIHISARYGSLRIAPHIYNDSSDVAALINALRLIG